MLFSCSSKYIWRKHLNCCAWTSVVTLNWCNCVDVIRDFLKSLHFIAIGFFTSVYFKCIQGVWIWETVHVLVLRFIWKSLLSYILFFIFVNKLQSICLSLENQSFRLSSTICLSWFLVNKSLNICEVFCLCQLVSN